jgi:hypothetical protein
MVMIVAAFYSLWAADGPKAFDEFAHGAAGANHYGIFLVFALQTLIYCASAVFLGKKGPILGLVIATAAFIVWSFITDAGNPADSAAGSLFNFILIGAAASFFAAIIAEYTVLFLTRIRLFPGTGDDVVALSYWRILFARMDQKEKR